MALTVKKGTERARQLTFFLQMSMEHGMDVTVTLDDGEKISDAKVYTHNLGFDDEGNAQVCVLDTNAGRTRSFFLKDVADIEFFQDGESQGRLEESLMLEF